jgi:hypothetical protein
MCVYSSDLESLGFYDIIFRVVLIFSILEPASAPGGMMEEWHQKLHNNTSPDDVVICEALLAYLHSGLDISAYWDTLHAQGITRERLASFDRAIRSEPHFDQGQVRGGGTVGTSHCPLSCWQSLRFLGHSLKYQKNSMSTHIIFAFFAI